MIDTDDYSTIHLWILKMTIIESTGITNCTAECEFIKESVFVGAETNYSIGSFGSHGRLVEYECRITGLGGLGNPPCASLVTVQEVCECFQVLLLRLECPKTYGAGEGLPSGRSVARILALGTDLCFVDVASHGLV